MMRLLGISLVAGLTVAGSAQAADMPLKAPAAAPYSDWSGVYTGGAIGGAWGREKLDSSDVLLFDDPTRRSSSLFGTSALNIFDGGAVIAPPFVLHTCVLSNCNTIKMSGIMAGGFAGVQRQWGNWVIGLEGSWDWLSLKKTLSATEVSLGVPITRFVIDTGTIVGPDGPIPVSVPRLVNATANVTRTVSVTSKIDQVADIRGKTGLTNMFFGPNVLLYATGGASIAHIQHSLTITQTTARLIQGTPTTSPRVDTFEADSGDTRLGWVLGAGFDWKVTPNFILGVLYRHHEFPKGTVAFNDGANSLGFGTSRVSLDSVQGRASILFPVH